MKDRDFERFKKRIREEIIRSSDFTITNEKEALAGIDKLIMEIATELIPIAAKKIKIKIDEFDKRLKKVGMIKNTEVNGFVRSSDNWESFEIFFNFGLMLFLPAMIELFTRRTGIMENGHPIEIPDIHIDKTVRMAEKLMKAFWEKKVVTVANTDFTDLTESQYFLTAFFVRYSEAFIMAHEFGHVVVKISSSKVEELEFGRKISESILGKIPELDHKTKNQLMQKWAEEFAADLVSLNLLSNLQGSFRDKVLIYTAVEFVFIIHGMLEKYHKILYNRDIPIGTHPPSKFRLQTLRLVTGRSNSPELYKFGEEYEAMADDILKKI